MAATTRGTQEGWVGLKMVAKMATNTCRPWGSRWPPGCHSNGTIQDGHQALVAMSSGDLGWMSMGQQWPSWQLCSTTVAILTFIYALHRMTLNHGGHVG